MKTSFLRAACFSLAVATAGCSMLGLRREKPAPPAVAVRTATLDVTPGIKVLLRRKMPAGFMPFAAQAPMWLQGGKEIGVIGERGGHIVVIGYGGAGLRNERVIAEDDGAGLRDRTIIDVAPNPDAMTLALAVANPREHKIEVVVRDLIVEGPEGAHSVASFDGDFESASVGWVDRFTIALMLKAPRHASAPAAPPAPAASEAPSDAAAPAAPSPPGLYLIAINGPVTSEAVKLDCPLSRLSWSPGGRYAVAEGDAGSPPALVDRDSRSCQPLGAASPIRVLGWRRDSESFLYMERNGAGVNAAYRYDLPAGPAHVVAISSGAAVFTAAGDVLALGNSQLTLRGARDLPVAPVHAELAVINARENTIEAVSLGFNTTPAMLAESAMTYSRGSRSAAVSAFEVNPTGPLRKIIAYRMAQREAFVVAFGPPSGPVTMSWSPRGHYLAIADGDAVQSVLTVLEPPL